jgi:integrase
LGFATLTRTFTVRTDAEKWARQTESELERGFYKDQSAAQRLILRDALDKYEREVSVNKRSHHVERFYIQHWRDSECAGKALAYIGPEDAARYRDARLELVGATSVRHELSLLSHLYTVAQKDWGMFGLTNPVKLIRLPKPDNGRDRRLTDQEISDVCAQVQEDVALCVKFGLMSAMRRSELLGLRRSDIDIDARIAYLARTKNGESRRVPLSSAALELLGLCEKQADDKVWDRSPSSLSHAFKLGVRKARKHYVKSGGTNERYLTDLHFHDLRHEAASRLVRKGFHPLEIMAILGHKDMKMLKRYVHPQADELALKLG